MLRTNGLLVLSMWLLASCAKEVTGPAGATQLLFTVQPTPTVAGVVIAPSVQVTAADAHGSVVTGFTGRVTVALATNPGGATLRGTTTVTAVAGVATFSNLSVAKSATAYTLWATSAGLSSGASQAFEVAPGPPIQLAFTVQPVAAVAGASFAPAVQIAAQDSLGNTVPTFTGAVTVALDVNPADGTLSGKTTTPAVAGVASFPTISIDKLGSGYRLAASASGLTGATSATFSITAGQAAQLAFTVEPSTTTAGATIQPAVQVTAQDALGNPVAGFQGAVSIAITAGTGHTGATLSGTKTVGAIAGVAAFPSLRIDQSGSVQNGTGYTLSATAPGLLGATSDPFDIVPGTATQLAFAVQPRTATAGALMAPPLEVIVVDALGNLVPGFSGSVTVALAANPAGGTLGGTKTVAAVGGVAAFATLSLDKAGGGYTLAATAPGVAGSTSASFTIVPGGATQLGFTVQPSATTAGATIRPAVRVTARDALGNVATGFAGNVTVALGTNPAGGTLSGTRTSAAIAGVAIFPSLSIDHVGSGYTLMATAAGLTQGTSAPFDIVPSTPAQLAFTQQPSTTTAGATIAPAVQVSVLDASGNTVAGFTGDVTLALAANPAAGVLSGTTTVAAINGVASFPNLSIDKSATGFTLSATAASLAGATSAPFGITPGSASQLVFTVQPSTATARATITPQVEVTARDALGNRAEGFTGTVTVALGTNPAGGTLSGTKTVAALAGVAAFSTLSVDQAGSGYTLSATAAGLTTGTSGAFDITAVRAPQLVFTVQPGSTPAGAVISPAVQVVARDASGQTETGFTGNVTVTITAATGTGGAVLSGTTTVAAVSGVATFATLSVNRTGTGYRLSATGPGVAGATSAAFTVTPGAAAQLAFIVQPSATVAGAAIAPAVQVTARDALGNAVPAFNGTVTVALGANPTEGTLSGAATAAAVAGVATFSTLSIDKAGSGYTLAAQSAGLSSTTSTAFSVTAGPPARLSFTVQPSVATAGVVMTPAVQVTVQDAQGNTTPGFTGNVTVSLAANPAGGTLAGTTTVATAGGVAAFATLSLDKAGGGYTLAATAPGVSAGTSAPFSIAPGAATRLEFTVQPTPTTAGATIRPAVRVTARDALGNVATGFAGNVTVALGANPSGGTLGGTRTFAAVAGQASFPSLSVDNVGSGYTLVATAAGFTAVTSAPFDIVVSTPTQLFFRVQPTDTVNRVTAGAVITPAVQVTAQDASGQTVTSFTGNVTIAIAPGTGTSGASLSGATTVTAVAGVATFANLSIDKSGGLYKLSAATAGLPTAISAFFKVIPGPASRLVFTVQPSTATAGATITPQVEVTARDALGNRAEDFTGNVTVALGTNSAGGTLSGTTTVTAVAGVTGFVGLSVDRAGTGYTLSAAAAGVTTGTSAPFDITAGRAPQLVFTGQPTSATAGDLISPAVQVVARDASGQTATGFTGTVTVTITAGSGTDGAVLSGATTATAVAGVATFATLSINRTGSGYRLSATASGVAGAKSASFTINTGPPTQLDFVSQPDSTEAGATIAPALRVIARDALGNPVDAFTGDVTMEIGANPGGGVLSGTTTVTAVDGTATFSDLSIDLSGVGYQLQASASGLSSAVSDAFIIGAGPATQLVFTVQPTTTAAGTAIRPVVRVTAFDALGNRATQFTGDVTVAIAAGTGTAGATLAGTTTVAAVDGVALFSTLSIDRMGSGYALSAAGAGLAQALSTLFDIN